ncbi:MAG: hypothetical protein QOJ97_2124 [Solirubrobacteraceae bacterium]|jgi:AcrR family transcriptional regulator|nr:hypothetical protein [Solirubrobacteraceae bacterium]
MSGQKRPYRKQRRAELEEGTRLRITESAVALHGTVGPAYTSISALAEHAGVRRSTVYRHFPDEASVVAACSAHWLAANPLPDLARWGEIEDPDRRLRSALEELYARYRRTEAMMANLLRDEDAVVPIKQGMERFRGYLGAARDVLMEGRRGRGRARVEAATGHALAFTTWRSLARDQGLDDRRAADLMCRLVAAAA